MNGYEKLIKTMREEAGRDRVKYPVKVAVMTSPTSCRYGQMELDAEDLLFADHLTVQTEAKTILKAGDKVLITRISEDQFALIEKVVEVR